MGKVAGFGERLGCGRVFAYSRRRFQRFVVVEGVYPGWARAAPTLGLFMRPRWGRRRPIAIEQGDGGFFSNDGYGSLSNRFLAHLASLRLERSGREPHFRSAFPLAQNAPRLGLHASFATWRLRVLSASGREPRFQSLGPLAHKAPRRGLHASFSLGVFGS